MKPPAFLAVAAALALAGCANTPGPVQVSRFVDAAAVQQLGRGTVFVEAAPGTGLQDDNLRLAPYKAAVVNALTRLGYTESDRASASQIALLQVERYDMGIGGQRNPVSVGVGGSTGGYHSGVGLGLGINLGGGPKQQIGTDMNVSLRDAATKKSLWEGHASFVVAENSPLAQTTANAQTVANALFSGFPGNDGETIQVKVAE